MKMKVTVIPIIIGALRKVSKGLLSRLEELDIGGLHYYDRPEYGEESWRLKKTCSHSLR